MKSDKHKAGIKSGTGRDGTESGFAFGNGGSSSLHFMEDMRTTKEWKIQLQDGIYNQERVGTVLGMYYLITRQVHCVA